MTETVDIGEYVGLREKWQTLLSTQGTPRSSQKDALYNALTAAWNRLPENGKRCAGFHCRNVYH